jgi:phosphoribosylformylglycinamidine cyclo-ligase
MQEKRNIDEKEMYRTFNMGIGLVMVVNDADKEKIIKKLETLGEKAYLIGKVIDGKQDVVYE